MPPKWTATQPLGVDDLEENAAGRYSAKSRDSLIRNDAIRCCVRGCKRWLAKRSRGPIDDNAYCPEHEISVSTSPTYVYKNYLHNYIVDVPTLERVKVLKVESW